MFRGVMYMSLIASILYPVDFSPSCVAMAAYVKRAAALLGARVSLVHVVDPTGYNGLQLYVRPISEVLEEHLGIGRERLDLIIMPTHAGIFRQMPLGSTTAKVINDADCPVLTSRHAQTIAPRPLEHREWLCAIGLSSNSERVLRYASQVAAQARGKLSIIHAVQAGDTSLPIQLDLQEEIHSA